MVKSCSRCGYSDGDVRKKSKEVVTFKTSTSEKRCDRCFDYKKMNDLPMVYIMSNKAWPGLFKVGFCTSWHIRLSSYQTASPFRDYIEEFRIESEFAKKIERLFHQQTKHTQHLSLIHI